MDHTKDSTSDALGLTRAEYDEMIDVINEIGSSHNALSRKMEMIIEKYPLHPVKQVFGGFLLGYGSRERIESEDKWKKYLK